MTKAKIIRDEFLCLAYLLDGWFHQDYYIISEDFRVIVRDFRDHESTKESACTADDIHRFLARFGQNEAVLAEAVNRVFAPSVTLEGWDDLSTRQWLEEVAAILSEAMPSAPPVRL